MGLYHVRVFMPAGLKFPKGTHVLDYSNHALKAASDDRYGYIILPDSIHVDSFQVIEVETDNNKNVVKILYQGRLDNRRNLSLVCIPQRNSCMFVKTVWTNLVTDKHATLNKSRYDTA